MILCSNMGKSMNFSNSSFSVHVVIRSSSNLHPNKQNDCCYSSCIYPVMEVIRLAELIVEWFLWTIEHTDRSLDIHCNVSPITGFVRHTMIALYA